MANLELFPKTNSIHKDIAPERNPLVSIVIPTYNRAGLLERAVRSALSQTYQNLEVVIVDDASTDPTRDRIESLQQDDHRVQYYPHDRNRGAQAARNTGIQSAHGEYIAFLDSDNEWLPGKLECQMALFSENTQAPGVVYCGYQKVSVEGDIIHEYVPRYRGRVYPQALNEWLTDTSTLVVHKDILKRIHGFRESIRAYQEWDLCIRLARECDFDFVDQSLTLYHEHDAPSISKDHLRDAYGYLTVVETHREEILSECGRKTLSNHYLENGRLFILADQFELARTYFLKSIQYDPLKIKAMMHLGASLLGKDAYKYLRSQRH